MRLLKNIGLTVVAFGMMGSTINAAGLYEGLEVRGYVMPARAGVSSHEKVDEWKKNGGVTRVITREGATNVDCEMYKRCAGS